MNSRLERLMQAEADKHLQKYLNMLESGKPSPPKPQDDTMIEVGKITIAKNEYIKVLMDQSNVFVAMGIAGGVTMPIPIPPTQALDLGQLLLKTVEAQGDYAVAAKELDDQKEKLDARYRDLISGLGLEALTDRLDENGGLKPQGLKSQGMRS